MAGVVDVLVSCARGHDSISRRFLLLIACRASSCHLGLVYYMGCPVLTGVVGGSIKAPPDATSLSRYGYYSRIRVEVELNVVYIVA